MIFLKKYFPPALCALLLALFFGAPILAQAPIEKATLLAVEGKRFLIEKHEKHAKIKLAFWKKAHHEIEEDAVEVFTDNDTRFLDRDGAELTFRDFRPGSEVRVDTIPEDGGLYAREVVLLAAWIGREERLNGLLEGFDPKTGIGVVDGERVQLAEGISVLGAKRKDCGCAGESRPSLAALPLGCFVTVEGIRQANGTVLAKEARFCRNLVTPAEAQMMDGLRTNFSAADMTPLDALPAEVLAKFPGADALSGGRVQIAGASFQLVDKLEIQAYVSEVGNRVLPPYLKVRRKALRAFQKANPGAPLPDSLRNLLDFRFFVIENPTFNAFALPNGMVFVHTGLLAQLENEAQLAAVLGHEVAHATHEHALKRFERKQKVGLAKSIFQMAKKWIPGGIGEYLKDIPGLDALPPRTKQVFLDLLSGSHGDVSSVFHKHDENQADRVGLYYIQMAGYDPREGANVWKNLMHRTASLQIMSEVAQATQHFLKTADLYPGEKPFEQVTDLTLSFLTKRLLDNFYSSHPKARKRYDNLRFLVATQFQGSNFNNTRVGESEFSEVQQLLAPKP